MYQDIDSSYVDLTIEKPVLPVSELQVKQKEIVILKNRLNHALNAIKSIQNLLTEQAEESEQLISNIAKELRIDDGEI